MVLKMKPEDVWLRPKKVVGLSKITMVAKRL